MKGDTKGDIGWWTRLRWAWAAGVTVWRDPGVAARTVVLDNDTYSRLCWGSGGVLLRGHPTYHGIVMEHLTPWQVNSMRGAER